MSRKKLKQRMIYGTEKICCGRHCIILRKLPGGLVKQYCENCGKEYNIRLEEIPEDLPCGRCRKTLEIYQHERTSNYCFRCNNCNAKGTIADIVYDVDDLFAAKVS